MAVDRDLLGRQRKSEHPVLCHNLSLRRVLTEEMRVIWELERMGLFTLVIAEI